MEQELIEVEIIDTKSARNDKIIHTRNLTNKISNGIDEYLKYKRKNKTEDALESLTDSFKMLNELSIWVEVLIAYMALEILAMKDE